MLKDYIDISLLVDRSGSMESIHDDVIGGLNSFISKQKDLPGKATLNVYQFDDRYETVIENKNLSTVEWFTDKDFYPRGSTNLYDAIGKTINRRGGYLSSLKESDRPEKVILVIFTDGLHNINEEFSREQVFGMVKHQEEKYAWEVIYLGADQDAMAAGGMVGVQCTKTMNFDKNKMLFACDSASSYVTNYRSGSAGW